MKRTVAMLSLCVTAGCMGGGDAPPGASARDEAITNAPEVSASVHPEVVSIFVGDGICGAAVLSPHWLLTAAHCVDDEPQGAHLHVDPSPDIRTYDGAADFYVHPDFSWDLNLVGTDTEDDVALVFLRDGPMADPPRPARLHADPGLAVGDRVRIIGYGHGTELGGSTDCDDGDYGYRRIAEYTLDSVGYESLEIDYGDQEVCPGDSGSPWLVQVGLRYAVAGVTANRRPINNADAARVEPKINWIEEITRQAGVPLVCPRYVTEDGTEYRECFDESRAVAQVAAGYRHACALMADGRVRCWGYNGHGQLGDGSYEDRRLPVTARSITTEVPAKAIAAGRYHTCAIVDNFDSVRCWGSNSRGQLGRQTLGSSDPLPGSVIKPSNYVLTDVVALTAGDYHTCAITADSEVWCWGANDSGQLGRGDDVDSRYPKPAGWWHDLGILPTLSTATTPSTGDTALRTDLQATTTTTYRWFEALTDVTQVDAGSRHTCARLSDGTAMCWGDNAYGQLGTGGYGDYWSPTDVIDLAGIHEVSAGRYHTCAVAGYGGWATACWGANWWGQFGNGGTQSSALPTWSYPYLGYGLKVSAGDYHTCVTGGGDGLQKCAGYNGPGAIGNGYSSGSEYAWVQSHGPAAQDVAAGAIFTCKLTRGGTVYCSGENGYGQLGQGTTTDLPLARPVRELHLVE